MEALQVRIESFAKHKRVKNPVKPSSTVTLKWPHPSHEHFTATPESLAEAGFYFNPSLEDRDNVTCYMCDKQLSDWEAQDDPFDIHWEKRGVKCCWAVVRCGLRGDMDRHGAFIFPDKSRLPTSKVMERARLETFSAGNGWIHDQDANHGANSRKMARAGFVYTPQHPGDDLATCLYCNVSLSGWEADDDPIEEHRKRQSKHSSGPCPFFASNDAPPSSKPPSRSHSQQATKLPSTTTAKPASRQSRAASTSKQQHKDLSVPMKTHDGSGDESDPVPRRSRASAKGRKPARSQSRPALGDVVEDDEDGDGAEEEEAAPAARSGRTRRTTTITAAKKARSRSKSVSRRVVEEQEAVMEDEEEVVVPVKATKGRSKGKAKEKEKEKSTDQEQDETEVEEVKTLKKSTRGKPASRATNAESAPVTVPRKGGRKKKIVPLSEPEPDPVSEHEPEVEETRPPSRAKAPVARSASRAKAKAAPVPEPELWVEAEDEVDEPIIMQKKEKSTKRVVSNSVVSAAKGRVGTGKAKGKAQEEDVENVPVAEPAEEVEEVEEEMAPLVVPKRGVKAKTGDKEKEVTRKKEEREREERERERHEREKEEREKEENRKRELVVVADGMDVVEKEDDGREEEVLEDEGQGEALVQTVVKKPSPAAVMSRTGGLAKGKGKEREGERKEDKERGKERNKKGRLGAKVKQAANIKVVEISTDEEDGEEESVEDTKNKVDMGTSREHVQEKEAVTSGANQKPKQEKKQLPKTTKSTPPTISEPLLLPSPQPAPEAQDVEMGDTNDPPPSTSLRTDPQSRLPSPPAPTTTTITITNPTTPPSNTKNIPYTITTTPNPASSTPFIPALSKLPFMPLQNLSDEELDMTVEEWIRYQMEVEYDKFRRDGERELARFKRRAEEVRGVIEGL